MSARHIALGLDSFSVHLNYEYGGFTVFTLLDLVDRWNLEGVQINLNGPRNRHLSGDTPSHYRKVKERLQRRAGFVELASAGTDPERLRPVLELCRYLCGDRVRTAIAAGGDFEEERARAPEDLRRLAGMAETQGVQVLIENHEDLTAEQLRDLVQWVGSDWIGVLLDVGNSLVLGEDPVYTAEILAPFARTVHLKDQVVVETEDGVCSAGTRLGAGAIDLPAVVDILRRSSPCDRILVQLCYGYAQPLKPTAEKQLNGCSGFSRGPWRPKAGPYDPEEVLLPEHFRGGVDLDGILASEISHLEASVRYAHTLLQSSRNAS